MSELLKREIALTFLNEHIKNQNLVNHMLASEAVMRALARKLDRDEDLWGITGLLHDVDLEIVDGDMDRHAKTAAYMLREKGFPEEGLQAVLAHNGDVLNIECKSDFDYALICAETITGMIVATALVYPDKKIKSVKPKSIRKRMKEKHFARNVNRDSILLCEKIGIDFEEFVVLSLEAMCGISDELGL